MNVIQDVELRLGDQAAKLTESERRFRQGMAEQALQSRLGAKAIHGTGHATPNSPEEFGYGSPAEPIGEPEVAGTIRWYQSPSLRQQREGPREITRKLTLDPSVQADSPVSHPFGGYQCVAQR